MREFTFAHCAVTGLLRERLPEFFLGSLCYRGGGCKRSETAIARIYVRSLCRWAVAPALVCVFRWLAAIGAAASGWKLRLREFTFARCAVGRFCANACVSFFSLALLGAAASGR